MDASALAQAVFFLSIALLAIVIAIFVFAASLLGRALKANAEQQKLLEQKEKHELEEALTIAQKHLNSLKESCGTDKFKVDESVKSLKLAQKRKGQFNKKSITIKRGYDTFTVKGGVIYPTCFFLSSAFFSSLAWGLALSQHSSFSIGNWIFYNAPFIYGFIGVAIILLGFGIKRVLISLRKIQEIAITSEEAALKTTVDAFKIAQRELEIERKPAISLIFNHPKPPINIKLGEAVDVHFVLDLLKGDMADNIEVIFLAPDNFKLKGIESDFMETKVKYYKQGGTIKYVGWQTVEYQIPKLLSSVKYTLVLSISSVGAIGDFDLAYSVKCPGYYSGLIGFKVKVTS